MPLPALELLTRPEFLAGLRWGLAGLVAGLGMGWLWRSRRGRPAPLAGLLFAGAAWGALGHQRPGSDLVVGVLLLALAGVAMSLFRGSLLVGLLGAVPGAWWIAFHSELPGPRWVPTLVLAALVAGAPLTADFDRAHRSRALGMPLLGLSVLGVLFTVPDTEQALVLAGAALPLALVGWPLPLASLGSPGATASLGLLAWVTAVGGQGRAGSLVGGLACLGLLVVEPLGRRLAGQGHSVLHRLPDDWRRGLVAGGAHLGLVLIASRVAGLQTDALSAALIAGSALAVALIAVTGLTGRPPSQGEAA